MSTHRLLTRLCDVIYSATVGCLILVGLYYLSHLSGLTIPLGLGLIAAAVISLQLRRLNQNLSQP